MSIPSCTLCIFVVCSNCIPTGQLSTRQRASLRERNSTGFQSTFLLGDVEFVGFVTIILFAVYEWCDLLLQFDTLLSLDSSPFNSGPFPAAWNRGYTLLCSQWDRAVVEGVFRYSLDEVVTRLVPGRYGFIAQRNPKRFSHRRKPDEVKSICQPINRAEKK